MQLSILEPLHERFAWASQGLPKYVLLPMQQKIPKNYEAFLVVSYLRPLNNKLVQLSHL